MSLRRFAGCVLLWCAPFLGHAQATPPAATDPAPAYRFYAGAGAYTSQHEYWGSRYGSPSTHPLQAAFGYQLRPRLALEANAVTAASRGSAAGFAPQANGPPLPYDQAYASRSSSFAVLARYTLTGPPAHRLQVDGVGGVTLHRFSFDGTGSYPDRTALGGFRSYELHSRDGDVLLTGGASVRYRLGPHLEAVADGTLSTSLRAVRDVTPAAAGGLRYRFGRR